MCSEPSALAGRVERLEEVLGWRKGLRMSVGVCLSPHRLGDGVEVLAQEGQRGQVSVETVLIQVYPSWHGGSEEQAGRPKGGEQVERSDMPYIGRALRATEVQAPLGHRM